MKISAKRVVHSILRVFCECITHSTCEAFPDSFVTRALRMQSAHVSQRTASAFLPWHTYMFTMKGCLTSLRTVISLRTWSTCLSRMTSTMDKIFKASGLPRCRHSMTRPKVPVPLYKKSKVSRCFLCFLDGLIIKSVSTCNKITVLMTQNQFTRPVFFLLIYNLI